MLPRKCIWKVCIQARIEALESLNADLAAEYVRLFVTGTPLPCPPYESVYTEDVPMTDRGLVMGDSTVDVMRTYREAHVALSSQYTDLSDHVAVELEFMHYLCFKEAEARKENDQANASMYLGAHREFLQEDIQ